MDKSIEININKSLENNKVRRSFTLAAKSYDSFAELQRTVGLDFIDKLVLRQWNEDQIIVDLGCGTGFLTQELLFRLAIRQMLVVDIALSMLQVTRDKLRQVKTIQYLCADAEQLPLLKNSVNHIVSNLALQWCQNLLAVFVGFKHVLREGGTLGFSTFGTETLKELKFAWSEVDEYRHVNEFYSAAELSIFLQQAGFKHIQVESKCYQSNYSSVIELMRELKGIGAHHVLAGQNKKITRKADMQKMISVYEKSRENNKIPATYEIIFVTASVT